MLTYFFFFNDTATTEIYTLSLHDALPIYQEALRELPEDIRIYSSAEDDINRALIASLAKKSTSTGAAKVGADLRGDRKSTRLNSSHSQISYAVFCLKKKKKSTPSTTHSLI